MAVFPFTVRATDSEGSYADRQFNITVRNSRVERFMALTASDAWTSPDGTTWTQRNGSGGIACAYGNGFWLILKSVTDMSCFKSTDGINYASIDAADMTFVDETGTSISGTSIPTTMTSGVVALKFWNGRFRLVTAWNMFYAIFSTEDGINWQRDSLFYSATNVLNSTKTMNSTTFSKLTLSEDNGVLFIPFPFVGSTTPTTGYSSCMGWSTSDGVTFTQIKDNSNTGNNQNCAFLTRVNGLYLAMNAYHNSTISATNYTYSTDGVNWTLQSFGTTTQALGTNFNRMNGYWMYVNGKLYTFCGRATSNLTPSYYYTSSDGLTWVENAMNHPFASTADSIALFKNGVFLVAGTLASGTDETEDNTAYNSGIRLSVDGENWINVNVLASGTIAYTALAAM